MPWPAMCPESLSSVICQPWQLKKTGQLEVLSGAQMGGRSKTVKKNREQFPWLCHALLYENVVLLQMSQKMVIDAFKLPYGILPVFNMNFFHTKTLSIQLGEWADVLPRL